MAYLVRVADNFHYQDPDEVYDAGTYASAERAVRAAKKIVDRSLRDCAKRGMSAEELAAAYRSFGEDPYVVALDGEPRVAFSAWDYAAGRAAEMAPVSRRWRGAAASDHD